MVSGASRRAVFLDRDGVLNIPIFGDGRSYAPLTLDEFQLYPHAAESVARLKSMGFLVLVVTNQPKLGDGALKPDALEAMHARLRAETDVDAIYFCPDTRDNAGPRRKPAPGMLLEATAEWNVDLARSVMIGDRAGDIEAGQRAGCGATIFIDLGYTAEAPPEAPDAVVRELVGAVDWIERHWR